MNKLIIFALLLVGLIGIALLGYQLLKPEMGCGGNLGCSGTYLVFKTEEINYSNYVWGSVSTKYDDVFYNNLEPETLNSQTNEYRITPLKDGYYLRYGPPLVRNEEVAFFEKSFLAEDWRVVPEDESLREEREKLIIKEPFTELYTCSPNLFIVEFATKERPAIFKDITEELNKMIDEGTLSQNCEKRV